MAKQETTKWVGWIYFASALLLLLGGLQVISGLTGIFSSDFFVVTEQGLVVFDFTTWGWINLIIGSGVVLVGIALAAGQAWARIVALIFAVLSGISSIAFLPAYPLWSIIGITIAGFIVYALALHGDEMEQ